jgi:hypothetical protein
MLQALADGISALVSRDSWVELGSAASRSKNPPQTLIE